MKYLGVFLGDDTTVQKNWEGVLDKVRGRLQKWKWLLPQVSYRGRTIIINNLVASALWHKFAGVKPSVGLIKSIQREMVNFFWDKLHWVPQAVLFLSKEDGGQGLINLASRRDTYRLQFIQKLLTGPSDQAWRPLPIASFAELVVWVYYGIKYKDFHTNLLGFSVFWKIKGSAFCNGNDVLTNIKISPALLETSHANPLLDFGEFDQCDFFSVTGKVLYRNLVKMLNKKGRMDTV